MKRMKKHVVKLQSDFKKAKEEKDGEIVKARAESIRLKKENVEDGGGVPC